MTTQVDLILDKTKLSRGAWLINRLDINFAAKMLKIDATWDEDQPFQLIFKGFHLISWQILEDEYDPGTVNADVIGMEFGEDAHRKPAILTTDRFEIFVSYSELDIVKA